MLPFEVPWFVAASQVECLQCMALAGNQGELHKSVRLSEERDGYAIFDYLCQRCGWNPPPLTCLIEFGSNGKSTRPGIVIADPTEVERYTKPEEKPRGQLIHTPSDTPKPVDLEELKAFALDTDKFPATIEKDGHKLMKIVTARSEIDAMNQPTIGVVEIIYTDARSANSRNYTFRPEIRLFASNGFPDPKAVMAEIIASFEADLKRLRSPQEIRHVVLRQKPNAGRSMFRTACARCGSTDGGCDCPGTLKGAGSPGDMPAPQSLITDPSGRPVVSRVQQIAVPERYHGV